MKKLFFAFILFSSSGVFAETKTAEVPFFNKIIPVVYDSSMVFEFPYKPNDDGYFEAYYERFETSLFEIFLKNIQAQKQELQLNDWLYFHLLKNSINIIFSSQKEHMKNLVLWFMLSKSGYETRIEFKGKEITVSVFSYDLVYGVPQSKGKGGYYIDLTSFGNEVDYKKWVPYRLNFNPNKGSVIIPFSFIIPAKPAPAVSANPNYTLKPDTVPAQVAEVRAEERLLPRIIESNIVEKEIFFTHNGNEFSVKIPVDSGYVEFLKDYPELSVLKHTELGLSPAAYNALIPYLKKKTEEMDSVRCVRFIMSFCRTGFLSKKDELAFAETPYFGNAGQKVIFAPEESLFNKYVDSEDISVLFYYLTKEVLNPDMVLLKFGKQISVAVGFSRKIGNPISYEGKIYALCDVSENDDSVDIGQAPKSLAGKSPSFIDK